MLIRPTKLRRQPNIWCQRLSPPILNSGSTSEYDYLERMSLPEGLTKLRRLGALSHLPNHPPCTYD
jgi:hypothetical protein